VHSEGAIVQKYSAALMMFALAVFCLAIHFLFGWQAFQNDAAEHQSPAVWSEYVVSWARDVFENLQSEFFQLMAQFLLLAGAFKVIRVTAYEDDQEEIKQRLARIEQALRRQ
jgi:predicted negative regulator of RcsB-dependent stress response